MSDFNNKLKAKLYHNEGYAGSIDEKFSQAKEDMLNLILEKMQEEKDYSHITHLGSDDTCIVCNKNKAISDCMQKIKGLF